MCLIVFAWRTHPSYRLILAGNRDEQYLRPSDSMHWWPDAPDVLAGRDLQAGGTWLAISRSGRFATVTNYRESGGEAMRARPGRKSRGELVARFVNGGPPPAEYCGGIAGDDYTGFSLLVADRESLWYTSNRDENRAALDAGVYGLSNASLDTPWPKLRRCRDGLGDLIAHDAINPGALFTLLADTRPAPVAEIPSDGLPFEMARAISAPFIRTEAYGTRCTTVVLIGNDDKVLVCERRFDDQGRKSGDSEFRFTLGT